MRHLVFSLVLVACAPGPQPIDGGLDTRAAIERDYCEPFARMVCTRARACDCGVSDLDACIAHRTRVCVRETHGTLIRSAWDLCAARLDAMDTCATLSIQECPPFLADIDQDTRDCIDFAPCALDGGQGVCLDDACLPLPRAGAACLASRICAPGMHCVSGPLVCARDVADGNACALTEDCASPARCVRGRCARSLDEGQPCGATDACAVGLVCTTGVCARPAVPCTDRSCPHDTTCEAPRTCQRQTALGAPCTLAGDDDPCGPLAQCVRGTCATLPGLGASCSERCVAGASCMGLGMCVADLRFGQHCGDAQLPPCARGLACGGRGPTCIAQPILGEACSAVATCVAPSVCDGRTCIRPLSEGAACRVDRFGDRCAAGFQCDAESRACVRVPAMGEPCTPGVDHCACLPDASGTPVCQLARVLGDACDEAAPCTGGLVCLPEEPPMCVPGICDPLG